MTASSTLPIRELFELPDSVRKGDFVVSLGGAVGTDGQGDGRARTVRDYAVTPNLFQAFERALRVINDAVMNGSSHAVYLHGSFGCGKSHFMAMLDLLLEGYDPAWNRDEFHPLRATFPWIGKKQVLQLPIHMLGASSLRERVFGTYVRYIRQHHAAAPLPPLFKDQELFEDAVRLREKMGDGPFFKALSDTDAASASSGGSTAASSGGWGTLATSGWDAARFDRVRQSSDVGERGQLFNALVKSFYASYAEHEEKYVELGDGLARMSRHAKSLGYDALILYLDELVLWLAGRAADVQFVQREAQQLTNLREAQDQDRPCPIVSFVAKQRDLSELIGADAAGTAHASLSSALMLQSGRFETITIEDKNLPAIVKRRLLRPRSPEMAERLADGFVGMQRGIGGSWQTLIGRLGGVEEFKALYPFSPALVEALVALSACLQRERTAIRILLELLVEHLPELRLGDVVPVGDVYDVLASSQDPVDGAMQTRFARAKETYESELLPMIRGKHGTASSARCQRLRDDHALRLGCSGCKERACRNDNRLAKTLLLTALTPEAGPFQNLTASKLVALNHGTVKSPIPGGETQQAVQKLRDWATQIGQLRVGDEADPSITMRLSSVDLAPVLEQAAAADSTGARRARVRRLLFDMLGIDEPKELPYTAVKHVWRGTRRRFAVRYGNVRELSDEALTVPYGFDGYVVIDYPFDGPSHSPTEDVERVASFVSELRGDNPGLAWLPSFFSDALTSELGTLLRIEHVLSSDQVRKYLGHFTSADQGRARDDLRSRKNQLESRVKQALRSAFGAGQANDRTLDPSRSLDQHIAALGAGISQQSILVPNLKDGLQQLFNRILEHRYPHHPKFPGSVPVGGSKFKQACELVERLVEAPGGQASVTSAERTVLTAIAEPLGLVELGETSARLRDKVFDAIERQRAQAAQQAPTIESVHAWCDPTRTMGLTAEVKDLLTWLYAAKTARSVTDVQGRPVVLDKLGKLPLSATLPQPDLPTADEWNRALTQAGELFGVAIGGRACNAANVEALATEVRARLRIVGPAATGLDGSITSRAESLSVDLNGASRYITALAGRALQADLADTTAADLARVLARLEPQTSAPALAKSFATAQAAQAALNDGTKWFVVEQVGALRNDPVRGNRAKELYDDVIAAFLADELNRSLGDALATASREAQRLLQVPVVATAAGHSGSSENAVSSTSGAAGAAHTAAVASVAQPGWRQVFANDATTDVDALDDTMRALANEVRAQTDDGGEFKVRVTVALERRQ